MNVWVTNIIAYLYKNIKYKLIFFKTNFIVNWKNDNIFDKRKLSNCDRRL